MEARWLKWCGEHRETGETLYAVIESMYRRPGHHTLRHVAECLAVFDDVLEHVRATRAMELAIWMHDIVYVPGRADNEQRSAVLAGMMLRELQMPMSAEPVRKLILATVHDHGATSDDEALMADIDLSILGSAAPRYDEYARHIREEFSFATDEQYRAGRAALLRTFLDRGRIYATDALHDRFEAPARANLAREIEVTSGGR